MITNPNQIGFIFCESDITTELHPIKIITEDTIEVPGNEYHEAYKQRRLVAEGVLQTAGVKNRNGRIYGSEELFPQLECERTKQLLAHGQLLGEMGHPLSTELARQQTIDEKNSCVRYLKFWTEDDHVWGRFKGTNNEYGDTFDMDLREGYIPEFSLRALGSLEKTSQGSFVRNLRLITYDKVIFQSDRDAYMRRLVTESTDTVSENKIPRIPSSQKDIFVPFDNESVRNYIMSESANLKSIKESFDIFYESIDLLDNGRVRMMDKSGNLMIVNLESYIQQEIMSYASNKY